MTNTSGGRNTNNISIIRDIIDKHNNNMGSIKRTLRSKYPKLYADINNSWTYDSGVPFSEKLYCYINDFDPFCSYQNKRSFRSFFKGYYKGCGKQCPCARENYKKTMIKNHGVEHPSKSEEVQKKKKKTFFEKFGTEQLHFVNFDKRKRTNIKRYGAEYPLQSRFIKDKIKRKNLEIHEVEYPFQDNKLQERIQSEWLDKTGKRSFVKDKKKFQEIRRNILINKLGEDNTKILLNKERLSDLLSQMSRRQIADRLRCSVSLIDKRVKELNLSQFQNKDSFYEELISKFLDEHGVCYKRNVRNIIPPKELDFYLPEHKVAIEFNGLHWHGELLGKKDRNYHLNKTKDCEDKGIDLIHVFQDEWDNSAEILKSIILSKIGKTYNKIYARKCLVEKISAKTGKDFLDNNHIQGHAVGDFLYLGLFYKGELVTVMSFRKQNNVTELSRLVSVKYTMVIGAAGKLFNKAKDIVDIEEMVTYSDRRFFNGNVYKNLGFCFVGNTQPGYFYFKKANKRYSRQYFRKMDLVKEGASNELTEWEIVSSLGYDRIWDCGHKKWIYKKEE